MANRYWVRTGGGIWDNTATGDWSATSGGSSGASNPTTSDDVFFDANSGSNTVTLSATGSRNCKNFNCTGFTGTIASSNVALNVYGSITLGSGMTFSMDSSSYLLCYNTTSETITTAGKTIACFLSMNGDGGTYTLQDNFVTTQYLDVTKGTFNANGYDVTCVGFTLNSSGFNTCAVGLGNGTWTMTGVTSSSLRPVWYIGTGTTTVTANSSTLKFTDTSATDIVFEGQGKTYNNVWFARGSSTASIKIQGSNTFADFKDSGTIAHSLLFTTGTIQTVSTFTVSGSVGKLITINSTSTGTHNLVKSGGGTIVCDYLNIQHSIATPTSTWYAGANSTNNQALSTAGSGWIFTGPTPLNKPNFFTHM